MSFNLVLFCLLPGADVVMALTRRRLKLVLTVMMVNVFIFIIVSRHNSQDKNNSPKIRMPSKPFWAELIQSPAYWNFLQQVLDLQNNPVFRANLSKMANVPGFSNDTGFPSVPESCEPDFQVTTLVKDYEQLPQRFKDFLLYMRCRSYSIRVDQPHICKEQPFLLLAVKSLVPHFARRQAIRESWGRAGVIANQTVVTIFLLGNATAEDYFPDMSEMLRYENLQHRDIIQWDYRDSFFNLTVKEVLFLDWIQTRCSGAKFVFKGDDDVFVNTYHILDFLKELPKDRAKDLFVGDVILNAGPHRDKRLKYFIPESVFVGAYPPYAGGGGYLFSGDIAARLHSVSRKVALYPIDDVYTGMCLRKLGLAPEKHAGFKTFNIEEQHRSNPCVYQKLMLVHPRTPQEMIQIWEWLNHPDQDCP